MLFGARQKKIKSFLLRLFIQTIDTKQAKVHLAYSLQRDQIRTIAKHYPSEMFYFNVTFSFQEPS